MAGFFFSDASKCDVDTCVGLSSGTAGTNGNDASGNLSTTFFHSCCSLLFFFDIAVVTLISN